MSAKINDITIYIFAEGIREREKSCIQNLLKSLAYVRDNTYHLHRHIWNDVHEDWPFYSEQDRQSLKRLVFVCNTQLAAHCLAIASPPHPALLTHFSAII